MTRSVEEVSIKLTASPSNYLMHIKTVYTRASIYSFAEDAQRDFNGDLEYIWVLLKMGGLRK